MTKDVITGQTIVMIRPMNEQEIENEGWCAETTVIVLNNGTKLYASMDEEGNGPGCMFGVTKDGTQFRLD